jgi:hypothetical protein
MFQVDAAGSAMRYVSKAIRCRSYSMGIMRVAKSMRYQALVTYQTAG